MPLSLVQNTAEAVTLTPDALGASATVSLYSPAGSLKATATATLDTAAATVATVGDSPDVLTLDDASGLEVWGQYWYQSANGWASKVRISEIDGDEVTLTAAPPGAPEAGDTLVGLTFTATIPASALGDRGEHYRLDWTVTDAEAVTHPYRQLAHVVAMRFRDPVTPDGAAELAQQEHPSWARTQTWGYWRGLAERANQHIRELLTGAQDYPHLVGDHAAFANAGEIAVRFELARRGRVPNGEVISEYRKDQQAELTAAVRRAVAGLVVDRNDSGSVDEGEVLVAHEIRIVRR